MNLNVLRHLAKEILALATLELFPGTLLVGGGVDQTGFYYDFLFPRELLIAFSEQELSNLEDQMVRIRHENHLIKELTMMRENSVTYLNHLSQPLRAKAALNFPTNILSMIEIGSFRDLCPPPYLARTGELRIFKLYGFKIEDQKIRVLGTAFFDKKDLKSFLKKYKQGIKTDPLIIGPKEGYFLPFEDERIYLEEGIQLLHRLKEFWDQEHCDFERLLFSDQLDCNTIHAHVMQKKGYMRVASFSLVQGDCVSIACVDREEFFKTLISSLHFIYKAFKIFAFDLKMYCLEPKPRWLSVYLEREGFAFEFEEFFGGEARVVFRVVDGYGRERTLSYLKVERKKMVLHRSLFYSLSNWIAHMIETGVKI